MVVLRWRSVLALSIGLAACTFDEGARQHVRVPYDAGSDVVGEVDAHVPADAQSDASAVVDAQHDAGDDAEQRVAVRGELAGLRGDRVVLDVGGQVVSLEEDGPFATAAVFDQGEPVAIAVLVQPRHPRQQCTAEPDSVLAGDGAGDLIVSCAPLALPVTVEVSGLSGDGLVLELNEDEQLPVADDGVFTFSRALGDEAAFVIEVAAQPSRPAQECVVLGGSGVAGGDGVRVSVQCSARVREVAGMVLGLTGDGLVLSLGGQLLAVAASGPFSFEVADGAAYALTIAAQPTGPLQTCAVTSGGSGTADADVAGIVVDCEPREFDVIGFARGTGPGLQLALDGVELLAVDDGPFAFTTARPDGAAYAVSVATPPPGRQCSIRDASGTIDGADVVLDVLCADAVQLTATTSGVEVALDWNDIGAEYDLFFVEGGAADPLAGTGVENATPVHVFTRALGRTYGFVVRTRLDDGHALVSSQVTIDGDFFREGFEGATFPPPGFTAAALAWNGPGDARWEPTTQRVRSGTRAARHPFGGSTAGNQNGWLVTPLLPLGASPALRFYENGDFTSDYAGHHLLVCTAATHDCTSPPMHFSQVVALGAPAEDAYAERMVDLSAYANQDVYLVLRYSGTFADDWYVDDLEIDLR